MGEGVEVEVKPLRSRRLSGKKSLTAEAQRTLRNAWWKGAGGRWKVVVKVKVKVKVNGKNLCDLGVSAVR